MSQIFVPSSGGGPPPPASFTLTGNVGSATSVAGNINLLTANSSLQFSGSGSTITLDFGIDSLLMGQSGFALAGAARNVSLGRLSSNSLSTGVQNVVIGYSAALTLSSGNNNTVIGYIAASFLSTGSNNVLIGSTAFTNVQTSSNNVVIGYLTAGSLQGGGFNIIIGTFAGGSYNATESNNICIGSVGVAGEHNVVRIGSQGSASNQQNLCYIAGIIGNTVSNEEIVVVNPATGQLGVSSLYGYIGTVTTFGAQTKNLSVIIPIPTNSAMSVRCNLVGYDSANGLGCGGEVLATVKNVAGVTSVCGTSDSTRNGDAAISGFLCSAVVSGVSVKIQVVGVATHTIDWLGTIDIVSVT